MSEAEAAQSDPQPAAEAAAEAPPAPGLRLVWDDLEAGDIEDMETYCGQPVFGLIQEALAKIPDDVDLLTGLMLFLPSKVFTALLGVAKRHQDPDFGMEQWRSIKPFKELAPAEPVPFEEPPAVPTPIRGPVGKRVGKPAGSRTTSKPG